jgi:DUF3014 family protein
MPDDLDFDLRHSTAAPSEAGEPVAPKRPAGPLIAIGILIFAAGLAVYVVFGRDTSAPVDTAAAAPPAVQVTEEAIKPLGGEADRISLPPLDESDPAVRELVAKLSSHPRVAGWLTTRGLVRNFAVVVANIAEGRTPASHLQAIRPAGRFQIIEHGESLLIDPRSYDRYNGLAEAVASLDAAGTARLYATVKPRVEEAYRDLGILDTPFDRTLERAIVRLLAVPVAEGPIAIAPRGIVHGFTDPALESLTPAQKQLLRTGPRNVRTVQRKLREIALALGIAEGRLPSAR